MRKKILKTQEYSTPFISINRKLQAKKYSQEVKVFKDLLIEMFRPSC